MHNTNNGNTPDAYRDENVLPDTNVVTQPMPMVRAMTISSVRTRGTNRVVTTTCWGSADAPTSLVPESRRCVDESPVWPPSLRWMYATAASRIRGTST